MTRCIVCQETMIVGPTIGFACPNYDKYNSRDYCHYHYNSLDKDYTEYWIQILPFQICWVDKYQLAEVWYLENNDWRKRKKMCELSTPQEQLPDLIQRCRNWKIFS